jgi:hypothetical protein
MPAPKRMASGSKLVAVKETVPGTPASLRQMNGHR